LRVDGIGFGLRVWGAGCRGVKLRVGCRGVGLRVESLGCRV